MGLQTATKQKRVEQTVAEVKSMTRPIREAKQAKSKELESQKGQGCSQVQGY